MTACINATNGQYMPPSPMYWILNTAVGGTWGGNWVNTSMPQYHYVDCVRHYYWEEGSVEDSSLARESSACVPSVSRAILLSVMIIQLLFRRF